MTLVTGIVIVFLTMMLSACALGGFALIYESKKSRQRRNYREGL